MGDNTIQSSHSQLAARMAVELAARQAAEAARREAAKQALQKAVPAVKVQARLKDSFESPRAKGALNLFGGESTPVPISTPAPVASGTGTATPTSAPVEGTGAVTATPAATPPRTFNSPQELADYIASSPRPVDLSNAQFNFPVDLTPSGELWNSLQAALPPGTRIDTVLLGANLSGATFHQGAIGVDLMAANLTGATFLGPVENVTFLYADLTDADFSGTTGVRNTDFAFSTITGMNLPASVDTTGSVFTGTPRGTEPLLDPNVQLNDPALLSAVTGTSDPAEQQRLIRQWEADGTLFSRLEATLPPGTLAALLPREWRSRLYDQLNAAYAAGTITRDQYFELKAQIFDAVDGRYGAYARPEDGPTLSALHGSSNLLAGFINGALADMMLSDAPVSLAQPYGGSAPPAASGELSRLGREVEAAAAGGTPSLDTWLDQTFVYNGQPFAVRNTNLDAAALAEARAWLQANRPDLLASFDAMAEDGLLTMQHLLDAGMRDVVQHLFDRHYTP
jgi:hypothetical protein